MTLYEVEFVAENMLRTMTFISEQEAFLFAAKVDGSVNQNMPNEHFIRYT